MKRVVTGLLIMSISMLASAEIFLCKDAAGRSYSSDRPIPECAGRAMREYGNSGMLKRHIAAPLTAEQRQAKRDEEDEKKAVLLAQREQHNADRALLARYHSEENIEQSRRRDISPVERQIQEQKKYLVVAEQEQQVAQSALSARMEAGTTPANLKSRSIKAWQALRNAQVDLDDSKAKLESINKKYDLLLQRYRELTKTTNTSNTNQTAELK